MKQSIKYIIGFVLALASLVSCELDTKDDFFHTDETLHTTYGYLFGFTHRAYTYVPNGFNAIDNNLFAAVSDEAQYVTTTSNSQLFNEGSWSKYKNPGDKFAYMYQGIHDVNYALENTGDYKDVLLIGRDTTTTQGKDNYELDVEDMAWLRAEMKALKAFYYLELFQRYGGVPLIDETNDQDPEAINLPRASVTEVVGEIVSLIDEVSGSLVTDWNATGFKTRAGRMTQGAALSVKARALLYYASPLFNPDNNSERWQKAAKAAHDVIETNLYSLDNSYEGLFKGSNTSTSPEVIWALRLGQTNLLEKSNYPIATPGGQTGIAPCHNLVDAYEFKGAPTGDMWSNKDPRFYATILKNGDTWNGRTLQVYEGGTDDPANNNASPTGYYLKKFLNENLDLTVNSSDVRSWILFRYAETLLTYAEAMNEAYGPDNNSGYRYTAREALNIVRARPGVEMPAVDNGEDQNTLREAIKHERRIELAFEGHRYMDLKRWKDAEVVLNQSVSGVKQGEGTPLSYEVVQVAERYFDASKMYLYPILESNIVRSDYVLEQNPNW
ncbi:MULTISPECIES: RagB/SusD family nutrient uptake outer membrane protein [unclassified Carboxylicivirga]|uniref:RagB/SusD family nutrient uptake outer membrane protein n=1 Tax=Carboxylicivirga TaxID=1628153 RepID=UPI003D327F25